MSDEPARPLTGLERLFVRGFIPIAAASWAGILLAEAGAFTLGRVLAATALLTLPAWWLLQREDSGVQTSAPRRRSERPEHSGTGAGPEVRTRLGRAAYLGLGAALVLGVLVFARPGEYLIEGADASVYLAIGRSIHQTGGLAPPDSLVAAIPAAARDALLRPDTAWPHALSRFPGGVHVRPNAPSLAFAFFHLLPVWIATFVAVAGPRAAYYVNVAFGLLAVLTTWLVGRRAWSPGAGAIAALLLASSFGEVWYARLPSSEMLAQWLLLSAVFFTIASRDVPSRVIAACAGVAVGLAGFARIDALFLLAPLAAAWLALAWRRDLLRGTRRWYAAGLTIAGGHALLHALTWSATYTGRLAHEAWTATAAAVTPHWPLLLAGAAVAVSAVAVALRLVPARARIPVVAIAMVLAPCALSPRVAASASLLFTPVGAAAMVLGFALVVLRDAEFRLLPLAAPFACEALLWLAWREKTAWPDDFRRFVPAVLPLGALFVAALTVAIAHAGARYRRVAWLLPAGLTAAWLATASPVLLEPPMQGVHAEVEALAAQVPAASVVLTDRSLPGHLALALQFTFGRDSLRILQRVPRESLRAFIDLAAASGRRVYVALGGDTVDRPNHLWRSDFEGLRVSKVGVMALRMTALAGSAVAFPSELRRSNLSVELYEVRPARGQPATALPIVVDVGAADFASVLGGFHTGDRMATTVARWTNGEGRILVPRIVPPAGGTVTIAVRLAVYRPPNVPLPAVHLALDDLPVGDITQPGPGFCEYRFVAGPAILARLIQGDTTLVVRSGTFVPKAAGGSDDARALGVAIDWIRLD